MSCSSASVSAGQTTVCTATVTDTSPGTFITPTGIVGLSQNRVTGAFTSCTLTGTTASAMCSSTFTASTIGTAAITAGYPGDPTHGSSSSTTSVTVSSDLSITSFTAYPTSLDFGEKITFAVSTSGGYGALSYEYTNLPGGCQSTNATTLSCTPTSSGNYDVTVTVTDRAGKTTTATVSIMVGPQRVVGLPQAMGLAVIFGSTAGIGAVVILSVAVALRRRKRRRALSMG
jgi:PKD repeat protein